MKKIKLRDYQEKMIEDLKDADLACSYLNEALLDDDPRVFLLALKNVCQAQDEMSALARRAKLSRENMYRILSKKGNPKLTSIMSLLNAVGFSLAIQPTR